MAWEMMLVGHRAHHSDQVVVFPALPLDLKLLSALLSAGCQPNEVP
jgi:hypothetical protein